MNEELEKIIKNNLLTIGSVELNSNKLINYIKTNLSLNDQSSLLDFYNRNLKNANPEEVAKVIKKYGIVSETSFAKATHKLFAELKDREKKGLSVNHPKTIINGNEMYRQLTHMDNHIARTDYIPLFKTYSYSCTGIVTKANSSLFKVLPESEDLILIPKRFPKGHPQRYIPTNYSDVDCEPIDFSKFNQSVWEEKKNLNLKLYTGTQKEREEVFDGVTRKYVEFKELEADRKFNEKEVKNLLENSFNVYIVQNASKDQERALCVDGDYNYSNAYCGSSLGSYARLLRVD